MGSANMIATWLEVFIQPNLRDGIGQPTASAIIFQTMATARFTEGRSREESKMKSQRPPATWWEYDTDGCRICMWPPICAPDKTLPNNHRRTLKYVIDRAVPHTPFSSMGRIGDLNKRMMDLLVADLAEGQS